MKLGKLPKAIQLLRVQSEIQNLVLEPTSLTTMLDTQLERYSHFLLCGFCYDQGCVFSG